MNRFVQIVGSFGDIMITTVFADALSAASHSFFTQGHLADGKQDVLSPLVIFSQQEQPFNPTGISESVRYKKHI